MAILPKYQLEALFEAGDLMTETTLGDFIDSAYNPVLQAGANIILTTVSTSSGDTITISSTGGGGGSPIIEGPGIDITTVGSDEKVSVDLDNSQTNLIFNGSNKLTFAGIHIKDEGSVVGTYPTINFIGIDVLAEDSGSPGQVNVYIPTPTFASHFNTTDGTTNGIVAESGFTRSIVRISDPTDEANGIPFKTGGWAGTNRSSYNNTTTAVNTFQTAQQVTGFSVDATGDATITVAVLDADGSTAMQSFTTGTIFADGTQSLNDISVNISSYANDTSKRKGVVTVNVNMASLFSNAGRSGGRYHVVVRMDTDTATDGGNIYVYTQSDVFWDINNEGGYPATPIINGIVAIQESAVPANIKTKHLSGIEYYILDSEFEIDVTDIDNLNANTQGRSLGAGYNFLAQASDYGLTDLQQSAWSPTLGTFAGWTNLWNCNDINYSYDNWDITNTFYRFRGDDAVCTSTVFDPWNSSLQELSGTNSILIDTYPSRSTNLGEAFADETERLYRDTVTSSYVAWDSTKSLSDVSQPPNGTGPAGTFNNGCIVGSYLVQGSQFFKDNGDSPLIGSLIPNLAPYKPDKSGTNPNYSTLTNIPVYHRSFYTASPLAISNVVLDFSGSFGVSGNATTALSNSQMKIYIRREGTNSVGDTGFSANPLAVHGGLYNSGSPGSPFDDGISGVDSLGSLIRTGASSGNSVEFTFGPGTYLCTGGFWIEIQLVATDIKLDTINATLKFSNGTSETVNASTPN